MWFIRQLLLIYLLTCFQTADVSAGLSFAMIRDLLNFINTVFPDEQFYCQSLDIIHTSRSTLDIMEYGDSEIHVPSHMEFLFKDSYGYKIPLKNYSTKHFFVDCLRWNHTSVDINGKHGSFEIDCAEEDKVVNRLGRYVLFSM